MSIKQSAQVSVVLNKVGLTPLEILSKGLMIYASEMFFIRAGGI